MQSIAFFPRLTSAVVVDGEELVLEQDGNVYALGAGAASVGELKEFLRHLDGTRALEEIRAELEPKMQSQFLSVVEALDDLLLLDDSAEPPRQVDGNAELVAALEDLVARESHKLWATNALWRGLAEGPEPERRNAVRGLAVETYLLWFMGIPTSLPHLGFTTARARTVVTERLASLSAEGELLLDALRTMGISSSDLEDAVPAMATTALSGALSCWSHGDPVVYFAALDAFREHLPSSPRYRRLFQRRGSANVARARPNALPSIVRELLRDLHQIDHGERARILGQVGLFFEMLGAFFTSIWRQYSTASVNLRRLSAL